MVTTTSQAALWFTLAWLSVLFGDRDASLPDEPAHERSADLHSSCKGHVLLQTRFVSAAKRDQGTSAFGGQGLHIYLVGNGPVSDEDHDIIAKALPEQVFRFNGMSNLRPTEPVGRVFMRRCASGYWGFEYNRCERLSEATELIFLGDGRESERERYESQCADEFGHSRVVFASGSRTVTYQNVSVEAPAKHLSGWSSGFLGLVHLRSVMPQATIEVFGMNWNTAAKDQVGPHPFAIEEKYFEEAHHVTVHSTPNTRYHRRDTCISQ